MVAEVAQLRLVRRGESADHGRQGGGLRAALGFREGGVAGQLRPERFGPAVVLDVLLGLLDDPQRVGLGFLAGGAPGGDAVAAEDGADRVRVRVLDRGDVQAQLEAGATPRHPRHLLAEDLLGQGLAVGGRGNGDAGVRVQVVHVRGVDQPMHGGVDRRRGAALAEQAVIKRGHHFVFTLDAGIHVFQCLQPVQPQHGQTLGLQRAQCRPDP